MNALSSTGAPPSPSEAGIEAWNPPLVVGDESAGEVVVTLSFERSGRLRWQTLDRSARASDDYTAVSGEAVFTQSVVGLAIVAVASFAGLDVVRERPGDGVDLAVGGRTTAGYIAERPGGYVAAGAWSITITRGEQVIKLSSTTDDHCGRTGVILPGDEVRGSIVGTGSTLRVGERFTRPE